MSGAWSICPACGAVVADATPHQIWHARIAERTTSTPLEQTGTNWPPGVPVPALPALTDTDRLQASTDRAALDAIAAGAQAAHTDGEPWTQPAGAHDAYPLGALVTHHGKRWQALTPFCVWEPPVGWREAPPTLPAWVQPTGAHDAYHRGDRVIYDGAVYESLIDTNTWSPAAYPAGWQLI